MSTSNSDRKGRYVIADLRGGINGYDPPWAIKDNECTEAINIDFYKCTLGRKRSGSTIATTDAATFFAGATMSFLYRHVPGSSDTLAELYAADEAIPPDVGVLRTSASFTAVSIAPDAPSGHVYDWNATSINGAMVLAHQTAVDRLHLVPSGGLTIRRSGMDVSGAVTATDTGGGAYAAVPRYYRQRYTAQSGGVTLRRGEPGSSISFTPSGGGTAARIVKATAASGENETHWELEASADNVSFYRISTMAVATTTYDDSALVPTYSSNPLSALTGTYTTQKAYRFIATDQNRLLGYGSFTSTDKQNRIEFSAVVGSLDVGDIERVDTTRAYYIDLDELDSGVPTGLCGPIFGTFPAFKSRQVWQLTPTGNVAQPYRADAIDKTVGAMHQRAVTLGQDAQGNPCVYFMSHRGPYRWGKDGLTYLGRKIEPYVLGPIFTMNLSAARIPAITLYFTDKRQVWFWYAHAANDDTSRALVYDVLADAWTRLGNDALAKIRCACLFSDTPGVTMSVALKPWVGQVQGAGRIWKADTGTSDGDGSLYVGQLTTKAFEPGGPGFEGEVGDVILMATAASGVTLSENTVADFSAQTSASSVTLDAIGTETRVIKRFEGSGLNGVQFVQITLTDSSTSVAWQLDRLVVPWTRRDPMSE
jgi:hypothetical protein